MTLPPLVSPLATLFHIRETEWCLIKVLKRNDNVGNSDNGALGFIKRHCRELSSDNVIHFQSPMAIGVAISDRSIIDDDDPLAMFLVATFAMILVATFPKNLS